MLWLTLALTLDIVIDCAFVDCYSDMDPLKRMVLERSSRMPKTLIIGGGSKGIYTKRWLLSGSRNAKTRDVPYPSTQHPRVRSHQDLNKSSR